MGQHRQSDKLFLHKSFTKYTIICVSPEMWTTAGKLSHRDSPKFSNNWLLLLVLIAYFHDIYEQSGIYLFFQKGIKKFSNGIEKWCSGHIGKETNQDLTTNTVEHHSPWAASHRKVRLLLMLGTPVSQTLKLWRRDMTLLLVSVTQNAFSQKLTLKGKSIQLYRLEFRINKRTLGCCFSSQCQESQDCVDPRH